MLKAFCLLLGVAVVALAQVQLPDCANNCITNGNKGNCAADDFSCLCHRQDFLTSFETCVTLSCLLNGDVGNALQALQNQCQQTGVSTSLTSVSTSATSPGSSIGSSTSSTTGTTAGTTSSSPNTSSAPTPTNGGKTTITKDGQTITATVGPSNTPSNTSGTSKVSLGPIIGGVVGGIAAIALLMIAFWLCRRGSRRRRARRMLDELPPDLLDGDGPDMHEAQQRSHAGLYAPSEASYPTSSSASASTAPLNLAGRGTGAAPTKEEYRLRDEVEKLKREVERLQAQSAPPQTIAEMKQLQSQAVRNLYGDSMPPPSYMDTIGQHLNA